MSKIDLPLDGATVMGVDLANGKDYTVLIRWLQIDAPKLGAIPAFGGRFAILQRGDYVERGDGYGSRWYELVWTDIQVESFDG